MKLENVVGGSFIFLAVYALAVLLGTAQIAILLFSVTPIVVVYVVWRTLRDAEQPEATFEEQFYQDRPEKRA